MTQQDFGNINPATTSGSQLADKLNNFRDSVYTQHSGDSRPDYIKPGMLWLDTSQTQSVWKLYDGTTDIVIGQFDYALHSFLSSGGERTLRYALKTGTVTAVVGDVNSYFRHTSSGTLNLPTAASCGSGWNLTVHAYGSAQVTIDPNGTEQINGATTAIIPPGSICRIVCDGTAFWARIDKEEGYAVKSGAYTALPADDQNVLRFTSAATLALTAAATLKASWTVLVINSSAGVVVIDPNGSEQINGATTLNIPAGKAALVVCDGTAFWAIVYNDFSSISINATGLAVGGGDLSQSRTISVPKADIPTAQAGVDDTVALTPLTGKALLDANASGFGTGQTWQAVTRAVATVYQNLTNKPIEVSIFFRISGNGYAQFDVSPDGSTWTMVNQLLSPQNAGVNAGTGNPVNYLVYCLSATVPPGLSYRLIKVGTNSVDAISWKELR